MPSSDAEAELAMAKQQGREMVNEARAYRERVLSELARRRELAREQIEQLMHGRDRLMQAFERARVVAVDVVAELKPLGEPNEYVNLSPTTGPVPVMVPNTRRPDERLELASTPIADVADATDTGLRSIESSRPEARPRSTRRRAESRRSTSSRPSRTRPSTTVDESEIDRSTRSTRPARPSRRSTTRPYDEAAERDRRRRGCDRGDRRARVDSRSNADDRPTGDEARELDDRDDVVVDLFARLRAESAPAGVGRR